MPKRTRSGRRTPQQAAADRRADEVARDLGRALRGARRSRALRQKDVADVAAMAASSISEMERGHGASYSLVAWSRAARAAGSDLRAYLDRVTAADQPRDAVHLRAQELIVRTAARGGWRAIPEARLDAGVHSSRSADVLLHRAHEWAICEAWDWFADVGSAFRDWDGRLARLEALAIARLEPSVDPRTIRRSGCWMVRATRRNRALVRDHRAVFRARFGRSGSAWLRALETPAKMPSEPALIWVAVAGDRLIPARLG